MIQLRYLVLYVIFFISITKSNAVEMLDLSGHWNAQLQAPGTPNAESREVSWPGTLDDAGLGTPVEVKPELTLRTLTRLQTKRSHVGPAWYSRNITIPSEWAGKKIILEMERVLWQSTVFVDGREYSSQDSLSVPHRHDLSAALTPGSHTLMVRIDNSEIYRDVSHYIQKYLFPENMPVAHAYTNHTQVMWNGVLGFVRLRAEEPVAIKRLSVTPGVSHVKPQLSIDIVLTDVDKAALPVINCVLRRQHDQAVLAEYEHRVEYVTADKKVHIDWTLPQGVSVESWDEFSPALYTLEARVAGQATASVKTVFGFRDFTARDGVFWLNGHRIFLRGNLECAAFPLTGYPPTDVDSWRRIFSEARQWGLNHFRFHSWCPPEAAFVAADEAGFYLQIELPHWSENPKGHDAQSWSFLEAEADRILSEYGNHPSFMLFSLGNELRGDFARQNDLVEKLRSKDQRRLYTTTTFTFEKGHGRKPESADDFFVTQYTEDGWVRGQGVFNDKPPSFDADYSSAVAKINVPLVSHEIGQYAVYPDIGEIEKYKGNLVPLNFEAVRDDLKNKGMLALAPQFLSATGRFAALLYKEEIERALRTPEMDGFQLLQLQDFPGQGTALVGMMNVFWEPKGFIKSDEFRQFCAPVVPLARFPRAVYERGDTFRAELEVANFLRELSNVEVQWEIRTDEGAVLKHGSAEPRALPLGNAITSGVVEFAIPSDGPAQRLVLEVSLGKHGRNSWNFWVYPRAAATPKYAPKGVHVTADVADAQARLAKGERVLLTPSGKMINGIDGKFVPVFWSPVHFPKQPGTMGILCDPVHPALRGFPTAEHSDWQWWDLAIRSKSVVLDGLAATPIVRVVDNFARNHSLANIFEARVGAGRLLFCAIDITNDIDKRPVARQLRESLLRYASSADFKPTGELTREQLDSFVLRDAPKAVAPATPVKAAVDAKTKAQFERQVLFEARQDGDYKSIRIPCILALPDNTVIAVVAGRSRVSDWADIRMLMRRSTDGGKTWEPMRVLVDEGKKVADNPVAIWDEQTKILHFLYQVNYEQIYHMQSSDSGKTFSKAVDITPQLGAFSERFDWRVIAPGPGHGIQLKSGRLLVPIWLAEGKPLTSGKDAGIGRAHAPSVNASIYSDDNGKTWHCGDLLPRAFHNMNETVAVPSDDGGVMFIIRNGEPGAYRKAIARSKDGATGWSEPVLNRGLYTPICFGSALRISGAPEKSRILFCNPDSSANPRLNMSGSGRARENLTVKLSYDDGKTWPVAKVIEPKQSAYSDMTLLPDGTILCLFEHDNKDVSVARFNLEWVTGGKDSLGQGK